MGIAWYRPPRAFISTNNCSRVVFIVLARRSNKAGCINDLAKSSRVSSPGYFPNASQSHSGKLFRTNGFNALGSTVAKRCNHSYSPGFNTWARSAIALSARLAEPRPPSVKADIRPNRARRLACEPSPLEANWENSFLRRKIAKALSAMSARSRLPNCGSERKYRLTTRSAGCSKFNNSGSNRSKWIACWGNALALEKFFWPSGAMMFPLALRRSGRRRGSFVLAA